MGRPPSIAGNNNNNSNSPMSRPWVPPVNMAGLRHTATQPHANKLRQFLLPIPAVPTVTAKAIRHTLAGTSQPFAAQQHRIRSLNVKLHDQRDKAASCQQKIAALETLREQSLRDIREKRQQEAADTVAAMERKWRSRYSKDAAAAQALWQEQLDEEIAVQRQAWRRARDADGDETDQKRMRLLDAASAGEENSEEITDAAIAALVQPAMSAVEITSPALREKNVEAEVALEKLIETRTEMIWLLKQVIKAEEKQKVEHSKKPAAKIESSRQA